ncbi:hypothetical protein Pcinc_026540 [Petrolisthes cinctipes]|uniref:Uncharacterized protein n=1 Tax=Petrolisthes cinctipes TaxID=88211 RepID=A0AAE1F6P0_PETCI|nr:hypothetical protein Pcinc_026540 [Petrolisthes cinctipes]
MELIDSLSIYEHVNLLGYRTPDHQYATVLPCTVPISPLSQLPSLPAVIKLPDARTSLLTIPKDKGRGGRRASPASKRAWTERRQRQPGSAGSSAGVPVGDAGVTLGVDVAVGVDVTVGDAGVTLGVYVTVGVGVAGGRSGQEDAFAITPDAETTRPCRGGVAPTSPSRRTLGERPATRLAAVRACSHLANPFRVAPTLEERSPGLAVGMATCQPGSLPPRPLYLDPSLGLPLSSQWSPPTEVDPDVPLFPLTPRRRFRVRTNSLRPQEQGITIIFPETLINKRFSETQ